MSSENEGTQDLENTLNQMAGQSSSNEAPEQQPPSTVRKGNEVFTGMGDKAPMKTLTREEYAKQQLGLDIPIDAVPLPSKGLLYPVEHPLHQVETVQYRAMTAREEDILMSRALIKNGTVITELIKSCLVNKNIEVNSLLSGDRNAIMMAIRISGYGREYEPSLECPRCEVSAKLSVDLADLAIKPLSIDPVQPFENIFEFRLPTSGKTVYFQFLTGTEEEKAIKNMEIKKKKGMHNSQMVTERLGSTIVAIDGVTKRSEIINFVNYMPAKDSRALRKYIDDNEPGVDMDIEFICQNPDCQHIETIMLPMGTEFFWPRS